MYLLSIVAFIPLIVNLIFLLLFLLRFDMGKMVPMRKILQELVQKTEMINDCKKENINKIGKGITESAPDILTQRWKQLKHEVDHRYQGALVPNGSVFLRFDELVTMPSGRDRVRTLIMLSLIIMVIILVLPAALVLLFEFNTLQIAFGFSLISVAILSIAWLLFLWIDQRMYHSLKKAYRDFIYQFDRVVPVTDQNTALVLESIHQNQKAFEDGVHNIVTSIDGFADNKILPALKESIRQVAETQEKGMQQLAQEFTNQLIETLDIRMSDLAETVGSVQVDMSKLKDTLHENIGSLSELLTVQRNVLKESSEKLMLAQKQQLKSMAHVERLLMHSIESGELLAVQANNMSKTVVDFSKENEQFRQFIKDLMQDINSVQQDTSAKMAESQKNLEVSIQQSAHLVNSITQKMKEAMAAAGEQIAGGIREVTGDNAEAIAMITEQSKLLRDDFDTFFHRVEEYSRSTYEDMDYHVQNVISKLSEEANKLLRDNNELNQEVLKEYQESTSNLLYAFQEQANSISLYAKEINLDVNDLSENLKSSVSSFKDNMQESVDLTMQEFDTGLAELSLRIANTVQSILDAVEKIPDLVDKK